MTSLYKSLKTVGYLGLNRWDLLCSGGTPPCIKLWLAVGQVQRVAEAFGFGVSLIQKARSFQVALVKSPSVI